MLQLDANEVAARLARVPLIDALECTFRSEFHSPARQHYTIGASAQGDDLLLTMPAWQTGRCIGIKLATVFPGNSRQGQPAVHAMYALFSGVDGSLIATLDGTELTRRRTAAASALAARFLARPEASRLLMVGTGALAPHIIETYTTARPITAVRVWGRTLRHAQSVAGSFAGRSIDIEAIDDLEAGVRWADIISCATLATAPLVRGAWLRPGQHLDLIGSFTPEMREVDDEALTRSRIYVDTRAGALTESGELVQAMSSGCRHIWRPRRTHSRHRLWQRLGRADHSIQERRLRHRGLGRRGTGAWIS
jgi:ornithine cyclodeaminase